MKTFRRGVLVSIGLEGRGIRPADLAEVAASLAGAGADALFVEPAGPFEEGGAEPFSALGSLQGLRPGLLGGVATLSEGRQPSLVAKLASSFGLLCRGPVALVLDVSDEQDEVVIEALDVVAELFRGGPRSYPGAHYYLVRAFNEPRPQPPPIRVLLSRAHGGISPALRSRADLVALPGGGEGAIDLLSPTDTGPPRGPYLADCSGLGVTDALSYASSLAL